MAVETEHVLGEAKERRSCLCRARPSEVLFMRLIRINEVVDRTGLSRTTIYRLRQEGRFPEAVNLTGSLVAWLESDVLAWIQARILGQEWQPEP